METEQEQVTGQDYSDILKNLENEDVYDEDEYLAQERKERAQAIYNKRADGVWGRVQALNLPANNEIVRDIYEHLCTGRLARAEGKTQKLERKRADEIDRLADEKLRAYMEETGKLNADKGSPAGVPTSDDVIRKNYRENPNNPKNLEAYMDYLKRTGGSVPRG